jgi:hypothetical protein
MNHEDRIKRARAERIENGPIRGEIPLSASEARIECHRMVAAAGAEPILLDELCNTLHRYLDEHPHRKIADLLPTLRLFLRIAEGLA